MQLTRLRVCLPCGLRADEALLRRRPSPKLLDMRRRAEALGWLSEFPSAIRAREVARRREEQELARTRAEHVARYAVKEREALSAIERERDAILERLVVARASAWVARANAFRSLTACLCAA